MKEKTGKPHFYSKHNAYNAMSSCHKINVKYSFNIIIIIDAQIFLNGDFRTKRYIIV